MCPPWVVITRIPGQSCTLVGQAPPFPSQRALGRQVPLIGFEMYIPFFCFSSPTSKYLRFLPKYLGRIVYCGCCHLPWPSVIWLQLLS